MSTSHFTVDRAAKLRNGGKFTSKVDAFRRSKRYYVCASSTCNVWHDVRVERCTRCAGKVIHFPSRKEADRYVYLRLLADTGEISELRCHPRFPCKINGVLVCTYVADFSYRVIARNCIDVEDVKGSRDYQDNGSALRRRLAEVIYGMQIRIVG